MRVMKELCEEEFQKPPSHNRSKNRPRAIYDPSGALTDLSCNKPSPYQSARTPPLEGCCCEVSPDVLDPEFVSDCVLG